MATDDRTIASHFMRVICIGNISLPAVVVAVAVEEEAVAAVVALAIVMVCVVVAVVVIIIIMLPAAEISVIARKA